MDRFDGSEPRASEAGIELVTAERLLGDRHRRAPVGRSTDPSSFPVVEAARVDGSLGNTESQSLGSEIGSDADLIS